MRVHEDLGSRVYSEGHPSFPKEETYVHNRSLTFLMGVLWIRLKFKGFAWCFYRPISAMTASAIA